jgi:23S rRNA (cytidine1920-2'-O)/16S rRNA (cytidine1409-2'-O)-methyltransferase
LPRDSKARLDVLLVERGLAPTRERARALILAGLVKVGSEVVTKAGAAIAPAADISVTTPDHPYVGRGGVKLAHALDTFAIAVEGRDALDIGASTGGFTDVLLRRGARSVVALDVGHGQLDWTLRQDPRVRVLERINARSLTPALLPAGHQSFDLVVADVSFISLKHILPVIPPLLRPNADVVLLVKPQFEAGRREVGKGGLVRDSAVHARVLSEVSAAANQVGLSPVQTCPSPIAGMEGNREYFLHARPRPDA